MHKLFSSFFLVIATCAVLMCCEDPSSWTPRGEVKFLDLAEKTDAQSVKTGILSYSITNCGKSKISGSVFAFTLSTDKAKYRYTVVDENAISVGTFIYGRFSVPYVANDEVGKLEGAVVDSVQFQ